MSELTASQRLDIIRHKGRPTVNDYIPMIFDRFIEMHFDEIAEACRESGILCGNAGWIARFRDAGVKVYGDYGLNVFNRQAALAYEEYGAEIYMPSHETGVSDERGIPLMIEYARAFEI